MQPKKYDSFRPKRATNIDGFFTGPSVNRPRQPVFRAPAADPQPASATLADMPRRTTPQPVLASSAAITTATGLPRPLSVPFPQGESRPRRRPGTAEVPKKAKKPRSKKRVFKRAGLIFGALVLAAGLFFGFKFYKDIARLTGNTNPLSLFGAFHPSPLKNQDGRINILVAGNSADDTGHDGGKLTDSIMVLSLNTHNNTALMLSIPRDLWVDVPGMGHSKINAAYTYGGMNLLQEVVEENLGLTINYQTLVNYTAFRDLVNAVGGITITIKSDDPRGIYDPSLDYTSRSCCALANYPNGPVKLDGKQALNLARARGDAYGSYGFPQADFDRTGHQRQMLIAIKDKASTAAVIANPLKVAGLVDAVGNNVRTNLKIGEIETLYTYMKKINDNDIASYNLNTLKGSNATMLANYTTSSGQSALVPAAGLDDFTDIQMQLVRLLSNDAKAREAASVVILNATDTTGLAKSQEATLAAAGLDVLLEADAPVQQAKNTVIDNSGGKKPATLAYLIKHYHATKVTSTSLSAAYPDADLIVLLGQAAVGTSSSSR